MTAANKMTDVYLLMMSHISVVNLLEAVLCILISHLRWRDQSPPLLMVGAEEKQSEVLCQQFNAWPASDTSHLLTMCWLE